ncbi:MAG: AgmX/PglI C-terminal domain-containing protein [Enhygromyxa sp.]
MLGRVQPIFLLLLASACEGPTPIAPSAEPSADERRPEQVCEHARDRVVEMSELDAQMAVQDAPDDQRSTARARGKEISEGIRSKFVEVCLGLDGDDLRCMSEIDGYADASLAARRASFECRTKDPSNCDQWLAKIREANEAFGRCVGVVDEVAGQAWNLARPKPQGGIIGVMVQEPKRGFPKGTFAVDIVGPLDPDIVRRIVRAHMSEIRSCHEAGDSKKPVFLVTIEFTIDLEGHVSASKVVKAYSSGDPSVATCMARAVETWRFPRPGGREVQVVYPFEFD